MFKQIELKPVLRMLQKQINCSRIFDYSISLTVKSINKIF